MSNSSLFLLKTPIFVLEVLEKYSATVSQLSALCPLDTQSQEQSSFYIKKKIVIRMRLPKLLDIICWQKFFIIANTNGLQKFLIVAIYKILYLTV